jgi:alpha-1,3/alpha-1,6-mannosyltransferase
VALLHPDLGLGGAERLVLDAAIELQRRGHHPTIFAGAMDPARAFPEASDGSLDIRAHAARIPPHICGRLRVATTITTMGVVAAAALRDARRPDVIVCDVSPHVIPMIRALRRRTPVVFYCHYPDRLLTPERRGLYRLYRVPFDALDAAGTAMATSVLVNSRHTAGVFARAYPRVQVPRVVYPGVDTERWTPGPEPNGGRTTIVSVARFERSKNVGLAIEAFANVRDRLPAERFAALRLVLAGGFDARLADGVETISALRALSHKVGVADQVEFRPSIGDVDLRTLMADALVVVYTPSGEHFGYVPVEAMACGRPVIAVADGGPAETVIDRETGWLVAPTAAAFADALAQGVTDPAMADRFGRAGRARVLDQFSRTAFGATFEDALRRVVVD